MICQTCAQDLARKKMEAETHDPDTLLKVREALGEYLPTEEKVTDCINAMQNKGILFRERA